jgi:hypothetical protein
LLRDGHTAEWARGGDEQPAPPHDEDGVNFTRAVCEGLASNIHLTALDLALTGMGKPGGDALLELLVRPANVLSTINRSLPVGLLVEQLDPDPARCGLSLDLSDREYDVSEAVLLGHYLAGNLALSSIDLSKNHFGGFLRDKGNVKQTYVVTPDGTAALGRGLQKNRSLRTVNLSNIELGGKAEKDGLMSIVTMLKVQTSTITHLDLSHNRISPKDSVLIADSLRVNKALRLLNLADNDIRSKGAKRIAAALKNNTKLEALLLSNNKVLRKDVARAFADALTLNETLSTLDLSNNNWERDFKGSDIWAGEPAGFVKILSTAIDDFGVICSSGLRNLNLSDNRISRKKREELRQLCLSKKVELTCQ